MKVVVQKTITEFGEIISKQRIPHNQSKILDGSGTSVNNRVDKVLISLINTSLLNLWGYKINCVGEFFVGYIFMAVSHFGVAVYTYLW